MKLFNLLLLTVGFFVLTNNIWAAETNNLSAKVTNNSNVKAIVRVAWLNREYKPIITSDDKFEIEPGETKTYNPTHNAGPCKDYQFVFGVWFPDIRDENGKLLRTEIKPTNGKCEEHKIVITGHYPAKNENGVSIDDGPFKSFHC